MPEMPTFLGIAEGLSALRVVGEMQRSQRHENCALGTQQRVLF